MYKAIETFEPGVTVRLRDHQDAGEFLIINTRYANVVVAENDNLRVVSVPTGTIAYEVEV